MILYSQRRKQTPYADPIVRRRYVILLTTCLALPGEVNCTRHSAQNRTSEALF